MLLLGPLAAPLLQATRLPLLADSGALARDLLSHYICPTPAKAYVLLGLPMAVCARCWGATIGLWAAWLVGRPMTKDERPKMNDQGRTTKDQGSRLGLWSLVSGLSSLVDGLITGYLNLRWPFRLILAALPLLLWAIEIDAWAAAPLWALLLNGAFAGYWAGLFFCSIWPGLRRI